MPLYLALEAGTNHRLRQGLAQGEVEPIGAAEVLHVLAAYDEHPDENVLWYDPSVKDFVGTVVTPAWYRNKISKREFRNRLGQAVRIQILALRNSTSTDPQDVQVRLLLEDMKETLDSVNEVDLENPDTIAGLNGLRQIGLLSTSDVARILAPSTVESE